MAVKQNYPTWSPSIKTDPGWLFGGSPPAKSPKSGISPYWTETYPRANYKSSVGERNTTPKWSPPSMPTSPETPSWKPWMPYFEQLGIHPLGGKGMTATSPALRARMQPDALQAMKDYLASVGMTWEDYIGWTSMFMPRTPYRPRLSWTPAMNWRRF